MKAKTYALDDVILVVMRGSGFTPLEKTIMDSGEPNRVVAMRHDFQHMVSKRFTDTIEELTGRNVLAFLLQAHVDPDITVEMFFIDRPLDGYGAVEIVEPESDRPSPGVTPTRASGAGSPVRLSTQTPVSCARRSRTRSRAGRYGAPAAGARSSPSP